MNIKIEEMSETDFRFYLDNILKGINSQFNLFTKQQDRIEKKVDDICKTIETMQNQIARQYDNCQNTADVKDLKERVPSDDEIRESKKDYEAVKKNVEKHNGIVANWKVYLIAGAVVFTGIMILINERYIKLKEITIPNTEYREKQDSIQTIKENKEIKSILK